MGKKSSKPTIITVDHLVKRYQKATTDAVNDVSFYVEEGALFALLGPNGAGKTTIISILTTILVKTAGTVMIAGYDVDSQANQVRQRIGVIFQNPSLDRNLTAEENVRFHANMYGLYPYRPTFKLMPNAYQQKVMHLAKILDLEGAIFKPVKTLSGGMKRKLEIVRSLMHNPKILFLDEPTTGLDPVSRKNLWEYIHEIQHKENMTVFLTTHYLEEAEGADYVCVINNGKLVSRGTPAEIKKALVEEYIEVDSKNRQKLMQELLIKKFQFSGMGPFQVLVGKHDVATVVQRIKTPLSHLVIHTPTLEQAYVEIIKNHEA